MDSMHLTRLKAQAAWHDRHHESYSTIRIQQLAANQDSQLPYKRLIGQVILDKNKSAAGLRSVALRWARVWRVEPWVGGSITCRYGDHRESIK